jgi:hypothetical protein
MLFAIVMFCIINSAIWFPITSIATPMTLLSYPSVMFFQLLYVNCFIPFAFPAHYRRNQIASRDFAIFIFAVKSTRISVFQSFWIALVTFIFIAVIFTCSITAPNPTFLTAPCFSVPETPTIETSLHVVGGAASWHITGVARAYIS